MEGEVAVGENLLENSSKSSGEKTDNNEAIEEAIEELPDQT